ncbi:two-component system nitrate/nitrite response regulator NarL [Nitrobacteraceae bacterium AZCC 1564]
MRCVSVVSADRHPVVLLGLTNVLDAESGFKIVASCRDGRSCINAIRRLTPDIAIFDIQIPDGLEILSFANSENLRTRLVLFTASIDDREVEIAAAAGAHGIIMKEVAPEILVRSLRQVAHGQRLLQLPRSNRVVSCEQGNVATAEHVLSVLTDREHQIMRLVSEGLSNKEIGRRLSITDGTIKVHLHHIFQKLDVNNRTVLAALAILTERNNE